METMIKLFKMYMMFAITLFVANVILIVGIVLFTRCLSILSNPICFGIFAIIMIAYSKRVKSLFGDFTKWWWNMCKSAFNELKS